MLYDQDYMRAWARAERNGTAVSDEWDLSWTGANFGELRDDPDGAEIMRDVVLADAITGRDIQVARLTRRVDALSARLAEVDPDFDPDAR